MSVLCRNRFHYPRGYSIILTRGPHQRLEPVHFVVVPRWFAFAGGSVPPLRVRYLCIEQKIFPSGQVNLGELSKLRLFLPSLWVIFMRLATSLLPHKSKRLVAASWAKISCYQMNSHHGRPPCLRVPSTVRKMADGTFAFCSLLMNPQPLVLKVT